jgi:zinc transport system substrate-binding protein
MGKIENASCIVINGAGMESFLDKVIKGKKGQFIIDASAKCVLLRNEIEPISEEEHNDRSLHDHHEEVNPHVWLSLTQYIQQVKTITEGLCLWDTTHTTSYLANMELYLNQLKQLKLELDSIMSNIYYKDIITFHSAFNYLATDYNLNVRAVIQQEPGQEPSAADIVELIRIIQTYNVQVVFVEPQYQSKTADLLHRETGVQVDTLDPVVTGKIVPDAYLRAMRKNGQVLYNALKQGAQ